MQWHQGGGKATFSLGLDSHSKGLLPPFAPQDPPHLVVARPGLILSAMVAGGDRGGVHGCLNNLQGRIGKRAENVFSKSSKQLCHSFAIKSM